MNTSASTAEYGKANSMTALLWGLWIILAAAGVYGLYQKLSFGHVMAGYGSYVPWGLWIALYFVGVGIAGGAFIISAIGYTFGIPGFGEPRSLRTGIVISVAAFIPAFFLVWIDLGQMGRLFRIITAPSFTSVMATNAWMYNLFLLIAIFAWFVSFSNSSLIRPLLAVGFVLAILFPTQSGFFLQAIGTNPFWNNPLLPVLFLVSAITLGAAALLLVKTLSDPVNVPRLEYDKSLNALRFVIIAGLITYLFLEFVELYGALWKPQHNDAATDMIMSGPYRRVFWIGHVVLGVVLPLFLLSIKNKSAWAFAAFWTMIGFAFARMAILIPGQMIEQIPGLQEAFQDPRLVHAYRATMTEYLVAAFAIALGMATAYLGLKLSGGKNAREES